MRRRLKGFARGLVGTLVLPLIGALLAIVCVVGAVVIPIAGLIDPSIFDRKRRRSKVDEIEAAEEAVQAELGRLTRLAKNAAEGETAL